jgi:hypothetical protein
VGALLLEIFQPLDQTKKLEAVKNLMASNKSFWLIQGLRLFILHPTGAPLHLPYDHVTGDK